MDFLTTLASLCLLSISAFLSASEVALFSLDKTQLRALKGQFEEAYFKIRALLEKPAQVLLSILVSNEFVNVLFTTLIAATLYKKWDVILEFFQKTPLSFLFAFFPHWLTQSVLNVLLVTPLLLLFGEITPKTIGVRLNRWFILLAIRPLWWLVHLFSWIFLFYPKFFQVQQTPSDTLEEKEFLQIAERGISSGEMQPDEIELMKNIFELDDTDVQSIMIPLSQVFAIPSHLKPQEALKTLEKSPYSRIPVYEGQKEKILGFISLKDLVPLKWDPSSYQSLSFFVKPLLKVTPQTKLHHLFYLFKKNNKHMALVQSEMEQTLGIVTMRDLLDEVFEEVLP